MKRILTAAALFILGSSVALYAALPGYHRAATPTWFGLTKVAPHMYTDAPDRAREFAGLLDQAQAVTSGFFGTPSEQPRLIICTTEACKRVFDMEVRGVALARRTVILGPKGVNVTILAHEQSHIDLRRHMGLRDVISPRFPSWFDEGLAGHLSQDARLTTYAPADAGWIMASQTLRDWGRITGKHGWRDTYGAAKSLVADIEGQLGRDGLRALIAEVAEHRNFDAALEARIGADWP